MREGRRAQLAGCCKRHTEGSATTLATQDIHTRLLSSRNSLFLQFSLSYLISEDNFLHLYYQGCASCLHCLNGRDEVRKMVSVGTLAAREYLAGEAWVPVSFNLTGELSYLFAETIASRGLSNIGHIITKPYLFVDRNNHVNII